MVYVTLTARLSIFEMSKKMDCSNNTLNSFVMFPALRV